MKHDPFRQALVEEINRVSKTLENDSTSQNDIKCVAKLFSLCNYFIMSMTDAYMSECKYGISADPNIAHNIMKISEAALEIEDKFKNLTPAIMGSKAIN